MHMSKEELMWFFRKVHRVRLTGCWVWIGAHRVGYGVHSFRGRLQAAHRLAYEMFVGPIPEGLEADHLCFNRACINPAHIEPVTGVENNRRWQATLTHCPQGHLKTADTIGWVNNNRRGVRVSFCLVCRRERDRLRYRLHGDRSGKVRREKRAQRASTRIEAAAGLVRTASSSPVGDGGEHYARNA